MRYLRRHYGLLVLAGVLLLLPLVLPNNFYYDIAIRMAINGIIVLGLNPVSYTHLTLPTILRV